MRRIAREDEDALVARYAETQDEALLRELVEHFHSCGLIGATAGWLISRYNRFILQFCDGFDSEDLQSELSLALISVLRSCSPERGNVRMWIIMRLRYIGLDVLRRHARATNGRESLTNPDVRIHSVSLESDEGLELEESNFTTRTETQQTEEKLLDAIILRDAIDALPEEYRLVICLSYYEHWSLADIGKLFGCSETVMRGIHKQALALLAESVQLD
jgi:RNA polymerase sigma factor (sigma-70 family)